MLAYYDAPISDRGILRGAFPIPFYYPRFRTTVLFFLRIGASPTLVFRARVWIPYFPDRLTGLLSHGAVHFPFVRPLTSSSFLGFFSWLWRPLIPRWPCLRSYERPEMVLNEDSPHAFYLLIRFRHAQKSQKMPFPSLLFSLILHRVPAAPASLASLPAEMLQTD